MRTILDLKPLITLTKEDFYQLCQVNPDVSLELSRNGELIIMSPVGGESGNQEANLIADVLFGYDPKTDTWGEPRYGVYVLGSEEEPQGMDLGTVEEIESSMELFRYSLRDTGTPKQQLQDAARQLDKMLMQPVRQLLGSKQQILISPDSNLNLIPFEALVDENNRFIMAN